MLQVIKQQFLTELSSLMWGIVLLLGTSAAGMFMMYMIIKFSEEKECWIATGTLMGAIVLAIYVLAMIGVGIGFNFNLEVSMGCTRKHFFVSFYIVNLVYSLFMTVILVVICVIENGLGKILYPELESEIEILPWLIKGSIPAIVFIIAIAGFCGALVMRFGMRAFWVLWAIWMFFVLVFPRITDAMKEAPDSLLGKAGVCIRQLITVIPSAIWIVLPVIVSVVCLAGTWMMIRRQQVTL